MKAFRLNVSKGHLPVDEFAYWLSRTSRTFALAVPLLDEPARREVTLGYLLFRIADTLEDGVRLTRDDRIEALGALARLLQNPQPAAARKLADQWGQLEPVEIPAYVELIAELPRVLEAIDACGPVTREIIFSHSRRTVDGMASFVSRADADGRLKLRALDDLRSYCYTVAGIVGEMLTELFIRHAPTLKAHQEDLRAKAPLFGEALQLVNILKDADADARLGRVFLPEAVDRSVVFELASDDLKQSRRYIETLRRAAAPASFVKFTRLPVELAELTLDCVRKQGPGNKISRRQVAETLHRVQSEPQYPPNAVAGP